MAAEHDPLVGPPPEEVPLSDAPLVRVIAQAQFPIILSVEQRDFIAPFQESIRKTYPVGKQEQTLGLAVVPHGVAPAQKQVAWRFSNVECTWRVSLAPEFLALETTSYTSRNDFLERLQAIVEALDEHVSPSVVQRLGLRYIDRVTGEALSEIGQLVRPQVLGMLAAPMSAHARHSLSETVFAIPDTKEQVMVRSGRLPAKGTVDPNAIEAVDEPSWLLDLDMFSTEQRPFAPEPLISEVRRYAERLYTVFRWAVTNDFLRRYGGNP